MSTQAGELVVRIVSDSGTLNRDVESQVNGAARSAVQSSGRSFQQIGAQARDMGTKMSLAATLPIAALAKSAIDAASSTTEAANKVDVVFGKAADKVKAFADTSAEAFGISNVEALAAAGTFGNLFRGLGIGEKQAAKVSTTMVELAGDLASFNDANPEDALAALQSGLLGESEPLKQFGVNLSEARVEAEAFAIGLVKPVKNADEITAAMVAVDKATAKAADTQKEYGKGSVEAREAAVQLTAAQEKLDKATKGSVPPLTDQQKLLARQSVIMKDTKLAQGDFQRSLSTSAANQQRVNKALAADAQAAIGQQLLPLYQKAIVGLGKLAKAFGDLSPEAQKNVLIIAGLVAAAGPLLAIFGNLIKVGGGAVKAIGGGVKAAKATVDAARRMAQGYRNAQAAQSAFSGGAGTVGGKLKSAQTALVNGAKAAGRWAAQTVRAAATATASLVKAAAAQVAALVRVAAAYVATAARAVATMVATAARVVASWVLMATQALLSAARMAAAWLIAMGPIGIVIALVVGLVVLIIKYWDQIKAATVAAFKAVVGAVVGAWNRVKQAISAAVSFVVGFVKRNWRLLIAIVLGPLGIIIGLVTKNWAKIKAVTAAAVNAVKSTVQRAVSAVVGFFRNLWAVAGALFNRGKAMLGNAASAARDLVVNAFNALKNKAVEKITELINKVTGIKDKITSALSNAKSLLLQAGRDIVQGLIDGVTELAANAVQKLKDLAGDMVQGVKDKLSIFSPSRVFKELGRFVVLGLIQGLTGDAKAVVAASEKLADLVTEAYAKRAKRNGGKLTKADRVRRNALLQLIKDQRGDQVKLAREHTKLLGNLTKARENLADLQAQARDYSRDVAKALVDSANIANALPEGVAVTVESLTQRLRKQVADARAFAANVARLAASGLNQTAIDQIVAAGVEGGSLIAQELAGATPEQIRELNALQSQLAAQGRKLGQTAADELYGAGIRAAEGLVRQLERDEARMGRVMERLAQRFANEVRAAMGQEAYDFNGSKPGTTGGGKPGPTKPRGPKRPPKIGKGGNGNIVRDELSGGRPVSVVVHNPKPERASETVPKRLRRLQQTGALT